MMIKITEHCSMGCSHCMNNATPNNKHMDFDTFKQAVEFQKMYGGPFVIITGGEPTEHPEFEKFISYILCNTECFVTVTTNGLWLRDKYGYIKYLSNSCGTRLMFQVTNDERYYPVRINTNLPVFQLDNVIVVDKIEQIYPQGKGCDLNWSAKASKCFNVRAIANQIQVKDLRNVISMLAVKGKFCTPHISIDGHIKLGESDLCPNCSHISKSNSEIMDDIMNFRCKGCLGINAFLPKEYKELIGEQI